MAPSALLGTKRVEFSVVSGRGRRYTYFRFTPDFRLEVVVPRGRRVDVRRAIEERQDWILKRLELLSRSMRVMDEGSVMVCGERMPLIVEEAPGTEQLVFDGDRGEVRARVRERAAVKELLRRWFLKESSAYVVKNLPLLARRLGTSYKSARVREMRSWGYCTWDNRLSFSWQLASLPTRLQEYVLVHELVHTQEHNHSPSFRRKLAAQLPDYRALEEELDAVIPMETGRQALKRSVD